MGLTQRLARLPKGALVAGSFVFVGLLWWVDYATGPDLSPLIFYAVPEVLLVWFTGPTAAIWLSTFAAFAGSSRTP